MISKERNESLILEIKRQVLNEKEKIQENERSQETISIIDEDQIVEIDIDDMINIERDLIRENDRIQKIENDQVHEIISEREIIVENMKKKNLRSKNQVRIQLMKRLRFKQMLKDWQ